MEKITVEDGLEKNKRWIFSRSLMYAKNNWHDAEDISSETTMRALMQKNGWANSILDFRGWLYGVMSNSLKSYHWGTNRKTMRPMEDSFDTEYNEQEIEADQDLIDVNMIIDQLPYPEVAKLNGMGYTNDEIGEIIGRSRVIVIKRAKRNREFYNELTRTS